MDATTGQRTFAELLSSHRLRSGVTQRRLAVLSTVSVRAIRDLELGRVHRPRKDTVRLIADGLGLHGRDRVTFETAARELTVAAFDGKRRRGEDPRVMAV